MNIAFRVDATNEMGIGHFMRCLTLANALNSEGGVYIRFICRYLPQHLHQMAKEAMHDVYLLKKVDEAELQSDLNHADWLGVNQLFDAKEVCAVLLDKQWQWLIVDHYGIGYAWHDELAQTLVKIMVIDDLADRFHHCDFLLDQTLGRKAQDYRGLVPDQCDLLLGSDYSLLRPEFIEYRSLSLRRRERPFLKHLLVTMGGTDSLNATGLILNELAQSDLPNDLKIIVVMGSNAQFLEDVKMQVESIRFDAKVNIDVSNMAYLMATSDLVVGAAGTTSWERCCLGVPSVMVVLAENQLNVAKALSTANAALLIESVDQIPGNLGGIVEDLFMSPDKLEEMSLAARCITNGSGADKVAEYLKVNV